MIGSICEYARWAIVTCTEMESVHAAMDGLLVYLAALVCIIGLRFAIYVHQNGVSLRVRHPEAPEYGAGLQLTELCMPAISRIANFVCSSRCESCPMCASLCVCYYVACACHAW